MVIAFHYVIVSIKFLARIPRYISKMTYEWSIIVFTLCALNNIFYPGSPYVDYVWIAPIASLLLLLLVETFHETPVNHPRPHHKHETLCENF